MAQMVVAELSTEARIRARVSPYGIHDGQRDTGTGGPLVAADRRHTPTPST